MRTLLLASVLLLTSANAFAARKSSNQLKREIVTTLQNIRSELNMDLATEDQLRDALSNVNAALAVLQGGGMPPSSRELSCVSRDNDGREPFQLARVNKDFTSTKIPGGVISNADCKISIASARKLRSHIVACATKDNDARSPFQAISISREGSDNKKFGVFGSIEDCVQSVGRAQLNAQFFAMCGSRDNDGRSPYVRLVLDTTTGNVTKTGDVFNSLQDCWAQ
jgi:hypothetical protein